MANSDRFGELRSALASSPDEDAWGDVVATIECWPDARARDEIAWGYAADRLADLKAPPLRAPLRLARRLFDGEDAASTILAAGELDVTPFDRDEVDHVAALARAGLRSLRVTLRGSTALADADARAALLESLSPSLERVSIEDLTIEEDLELLRRALERALPRELALGSNRLSDAHVSALLSPAVVGALEALDLSWNWKSYEEVCNCLEGVVFSGLRGLDLEGVDLGSEGIETLLENASLVGVERLDLNLNDLDDLSVERLAASPLARGIVDLDLGFNSGFGDQGVVALARAPMPALRRLVLSSAEFTAVGLLALGRAPWLAQIEHLDLAFCEHLQPRELVALMGPDGLTGLRSLELDYIETLGDELLSHVVGGLTGPLESLSLLLTGAGDLVARALVSNPEAFASLRRLWFGADTLTLEGIGALTSCAHLRPDDLILSSPAFDADALELIAGSEWSPRSVQFGGGDFDDRALEVLSRWPGLRSVRALDLRGCSASIEAITMLIDSPWLGHLDNLNLAQLNVDTDDLLELLSSRPSLASLQKLTVGVPQGSAGARGYAAVASSPHLRNLSWFDADFSALSEANRAILVESPNLSGAVRGHAALAGA